MALLALFLSACYVPVDQSKARSKAPEDTGGTPSLQLVVEKLEERITGQWTASGSNSSPDEAVAIELIPSSQAGAQGIGFNAPAKPFAFFNPSARIKFPWNLAREAGSVEFKGSRSGGKWRGRFTFVPDAAYVTAASAVLSAPPTKAELLLMFCLDTRRAEVEAYCRSGLPLAAIDICRSKSQRVTPEYLSAVRSAGNYSLNEILQLAAIGMPANYPAEAQKQGARFTVQELAQLYRFGVTAAEARAWTALDAAFPVDDMTKLHTHGVSPQLAYAARRIQNNLGVSDLIKLKDFGVTAEFLEGFKDVQGECTVEDAIRVMANHVEPKEVAAWREYDREIPIHDIVQLHNRGVTEDYPRRLKGMKFSVGDFIQLITYSVGSEEVEVWRKAGFNYSAWDLVVLHSSGVPSGYAATLAADGRTNLTAAVVVRRFEQEKSALEKAPGKKP